MDYRLLNIPRSAEAVRVALNVAEAI